MSTFLATLFSHCLDTRKFWVLYTPWGMQALRKTDLLNPRPPFRFAMLQNFLAFSFCYGLAFKLLRKILGNHSFTFWVFELFPTHYTKHTNKTNKAKRVNLLKPNKQTPEKMYQKKEKKLIKNLCINKKNTTFTE